LPTLAALVRYTRCDLHHNRGRSRQHLADGPPVSPRISLRGIAGHRSDGTAAWELDG
jgi:hypothetical protein